MKPTQIVLFFKIGDRRQRLINRFFRPQLTPACWTNLAVHHLALVRKQRAAVALATVLSRGLIGDSR